MAGEALKTVQVSAHVPTSTVTSSAGASAVITLSAPPTGFAWHVGEVVFSYDTTPTGGSVTISDGTTSVSFHAPAAGPGFVPFLPALRFACATAVTITLAAGGGSVVGKITVTAWKEANS